MCQLQIGRLLGISATTVYRVQNRRRLLNTVAGLIEDLRGGEKKHKSNGDRLNLDIVPPCALPRLLWELVSRFAVSP